MKCANHLLNRLSFIQPVFEAAPTVPVGALSISSGLNLARGNISIGGMNVPQAFMQQTAVTVFPALHYKVFQQLSCLFPYNFLGLVAHSVPTFIYVEIVFWWNNGHTVLEQYRF